MHSLVNTTKVPQVVGTIVLLTLITSCTGLPRNTGTEKNNTNESAPIIRVEPEKPEIPDEPAEAEEKQEGETKTETEKIKIEIKEYKPLTEQEIEKIILDTLPPQFRPLTHDDGSIMVLYHDIDLNGFKDAFFLVVEAEAGIPTNIGYFSDESRIFKPGVNQVDFFLAVYFQLRGEMISMYRIPVRSALVLDDLSAIFLREGSSLPFCIQITFHTRRGLEHEWIIFSGYNRFSLHTFIDDVVTKNIIRDIEGNGILDIIEFYQGFEDGVGFETYLTWYKWDGRTYVKSATTNIVRNLNQFLHEVSLSLSSGDLSQILRFIEIDLETSSRPIENEELFRTYFKITNRSDGNDLDDPICLDFQNVTFPAIFENPFPILQDEKDFSSFSVRFICRDGTMYLCETIIEMEVNPFQGKQFRFLPHGNL